MIDVIEYLQYLHGLQSSTNFNFPIPPKLITRSALSPYNFEPLNNEVFDECQQFLVKRLAHFCRNVDQFSS